jgi:hypothetical protein
LRTEIPERGTSLEDGFLDVAGHPFVTLEDLGDELPLPIPRNLKALDLACRGKEVALVVAVALAAPGGGELSVAGHKVLGHLLFLEDLLQDGLEALPNYSGLHVPFHGFLELFIWGQVPTSSLNL